jgi:hypothetical protein
MAEKQKLGVKQAARDLYQAQRISLEMAAWAMNNAGYTREETSEWLELKEEEDEYADGKATLDASDR